MYIYIYKLQIINSYKNIALKCIKCLISRNINFNPNSLLLLII